MEIVPEFINNPSFKEFIMGCMREVLEKSDVGMKQEISEDEARDILTVKGKRPSPATMARYRSQKNGALPYIPGRPVKYIREHVYTFRDNQFVIQRNNFM